MAMNCTIRCLVDKYVILNLFARGFDETLVYFKATVDVIKTFQEPRASGKCKAECVFA